MIFQISNEGVDTWEPEVAKGPFGFAEALQQSGDQVLPRDYSREGFVWRIYIGTFQGKLICEAIY